MNLFWLIFAHFLADLPLQGDWVCKNKGKEPLFMIGHCVIWAGIISLALITIGLFSVWKLWFLFIGHYLMDSLKCKMIGERDTINFREIPIIKRKIKLWVYGDQLFHLLQLLVVYFI